MSAGGRRCLAPARRHPGVREDVLEVNAVLGPDPETGPDEGLAVGGDGAAQVDLGRANLVVLLEGDVAAHHVVEEDAEGPDCEWSRLVPVAPDPLRWRVHSRTCKYNKIKNLNFLSLSHFLSLILTQHTHTNKNTHTQMIRNVIHMNCYL